MSGCEWPVDTTCLPDLPAEEDPGYAAAKTQRDAAENLAVQVLWALSGRQFGVCTYIARPCTHSWGDRRPFESGPVTSYVLSWEGDSWLNWPCGCGSRCTETGPRAVHLPGPAQEVIEVIVSGVALPASGYRLEGDVLHRVGANWPNQDLSRPMGEPNTWSVEYTVGNPVPAGVDRLTGLLAKEFLAACNGDNKCRLPRNVTQVSRQGVSYQVFNPNSIYEAGKTGLAEVDSWLAAINPNRLAAPVSVL